MDAERLATHAERCIARARNACRIAWRTRCAGPIVLFRLRALSGSVLFFPESAPGSGCRHAALENTKLVSPLVEPKRRRMMF